MDIGLILPSYREGASVEAIDAGAEAAARLGWHSVFTTDHLLVEPSKRSEDYFTIFEALVTVAHVAARQPNLRVGISVVVVPMRDAVQLAKELASLDALSGGRLIAGVGVGWNRKEFAHLGLEDRFSHRGAYLDESIELWRYLWGGGTGPFEGRFHSFEDARFLPLPPQGRELAVWVGGREPAALERAGRLGNGYHSSSSSPAQVAVRMPIVRAAAEAAGRPAPTISARFRVAFGRHDVPFFMVAGTPEQMVGELREFEQIGVDHVAVDFAETDPAKLVALVERFDSEVLAALR
ncbi:MAG TPA: TIGR03619 family F420-dependent LLM class oxidoreductase [Candidatus Limnocylindrales bacterium]|nr:TIGR03619 family F420-dependent LLM class oxidoreductase [Candidatus Limnocylindrales bacterium]